MTGDQRSERAEGKHRDSHAEQDFIAEGQRSDRAEEKHRDPHAEWDFIPGGQR